MLENENYETVFFFCFSSSECGVCFMVDNFSYVKTDR